ncbi:MAG: hypothetical protein HFG54_08735 [Lachnospiraceae bacterium]|jgi:hypothetical protein|nr:hypothetical protein [Lachnospiraceae bacterium]
MMKIRMRAVSWILGISLLSALALPFSSAASLREDEPQTRAELTLKYEHPGMEFQLYRVAEEDGRLTEHFKAGDFQENGYLTEHENNGDMQKITIALCQYVGQKGTKPDYTGLMEEDEEEITLSGLKPGYYLVMGTSLTIGEVVHMPNPFLVQLSRGEKLLCDIKSDHFPVNPTEPTDPTDPTKPMVPIGPGGSDSSGGGSFGSSSSGGGGGPATTTIGEEAAPLASFTNPPDELMTLEDPQIPLAALPMIPKLGDLGAAGYLYGMFVSLLLFALSLVFYQAVSRAEER